ncbi:hypothetical protein [Halorubrum amylolyticum]|uniref:hypothetical protein n=1 Tax=Halorubrum amylolyticum TaxID=2508724 RepID=UPI001008AC5E|nr:hypothetical protein [Halorubrum amylolyticum]
MSNAVFREGQVTVIPTSHLHGAKEELTVLSYIIDNKIDDYNVDPNVKDTPLLVAVDEAHNYVSDLADEALLAATAPVTKPTTTSPTQHSPGTIHRQLRS